MDKSSSIQHASKSSVAGQRRPLSLVTLISWSSGHTFVAFRLSCLPLAFLATWVVVVRFEWDFLTLCAHGIEPVLLARCAVAGGSILGRNLVTNDGRGVEWCPDFDAALHALQWSVLTRAFCYYELMPSRLLRGPDVWSQVGRYFVQISLQTMVVASNGGRWTTCSSLPCVLVCMPCHHGS